MNNLLAQSSTLGKFTNPLYSNSIGNYLSSNSSASFWNKFISAGIGLTFIAGSVIFFFMLISGAIQWIMSGGDKASLEGARSRITNAIIGIVILLSTYIIAKIVERFFGISILTLDIGSLIIR